MVVPAVEPLEGGVGVLLVVELGVHVAHLDTRTTITEIGYKVRDP